MRGFAAGVHLVYFQLKFREHGLAVKRCAELFEEVVYQVSALFFILRIFSAGTA